MFNSIRLTKKDNNKFKKLKHIKICPFEIKDNLCIKAEKVMLKKSLTVLKRFRLIYKLSVLV